MKMVSIRLGPAALTALKRQLRELGAAGKEALAVIEQAAKRADRRGEDGVAP